MSVKFNKMMAKMKQKLGFTLIEMLIVIAIIAIIVSIGMPMVRISLVKSAAATNAANLRAIKGQISTMRVTNPKAFEALDFNEFKDENVGNKDDIVGSLTNIIGLLGSDLSTATADANGTLTISNDIVINNVPTAKKMEITDINGKTIVIEDGAPMSALVSKNGAETTYNNLSIDVFVDIAEDGKYDGAFGKSSDELWQDAVGDIEDEIRDGVTCNYPGCSNSVSFIGGLSEFCSDHKELKHCDTCNIDYRGFTCPNTDAHGHKCADNTNDHLCDECGTQCTTCNHLLLFFACSICGNNARGCPYCAPLG